MQFVYLIMTHQNPAQISRLVHAVLSTSRDGWVLLLHDRKGCSLQAMPWRHDPRVSVVASPVDVVRGEFSQVEAYLHALKFLQTAPRPWDWMVCLSGQDYPVRPTRETEEFLASAPYAAFLHYWPVGGAGDVWRPRQGRIRYHYRYYALPGWAAPLLRLMKWTHSLQGLWRVFLTYAPKIGVRVRRLPFGDDLRLHGGFAWHYLRRECVDYIIDFCRRRPDVVEHYRHCIAPDESFVPTVLANAAAIRICNDNRRYVDWSESQDGRPRVLTSRDLPAMCREAYDFARKFDPQVDAAVLDALDRRIAPGASGG